MERLSIDEIIEHCKRKIARYEQLNSTKTLESADISNNFIREYWEHRQAGKWLQELKEYKQLEEQGLLVRLPFNVGDTVYQPSEGFIEPCTVETIFLSDYMDTEGNYSNMADIHYDREDCPYVSTGIYFTEIGKTVFLTPEEAEQALKETENDR